MQTKVANAWAPLLALLVYGGGAVHLDVVPSDFLDGVTDAIVMTCLPDGTGVKARQILLMEISKDAETPIVNIQPPDKLNYAHGDGGLFQAQGAINNTDIAESYLTLTIRYPSSDNVGIYTCVMSYLDETGLLKQDRDMVRLSLNATNGASLDDKVSNLQKSVDNLLERVKAVERSNQQMLLSVRNQSDQLEAVKEKMSLTAAFSATLREEKNIVTGDTILFNDVMLNEGQGYNQSSGIFTAPSAGLYVFHVVLEIGYGGAVGEILLNVAGANLAKMYTQDRDFGDQGSISVVARLKKSDAVKVVVNLASGSNPKALSERLCVFSGILVRP
ncbi:uncharacterized protein LOC131937223 [Physella acuta]|uniref:uncharacterized protein LOC131937223 n=1 Tax=Physella acuta TaxID=109671 RepID=UPI0027DE53A4|nr:uncharacterized protein LOC131937223 [Physella acuta]